jgi:hypothetical protein
MCVLLVFRIQHMVPMLLRKQLQVASRMSYGHKYSGTDIIRRTVPRNKTYPSSVAQKYYMSLLGAQQAVQKFFTRHHG